MKIEEIIQTGELRRIKYENTEDVSVTRLFQGIYGVGTVDVSFFHFLDDKRDFRAIHGDAMVGSRLQNT
jgi:hypothetical protein